VTKVSIKTSPIGPTNPYNCPREERGTHEYGNNLSIPSFEYASASVPLPMRGFKFCSTTLSEIVSTLATNVGTHDVREANILPIDSTLCCQPDSPLLALEIIAGRLAIPVEPILASNVMAIKNCEMKNRAITLMILRVRPLMLEKLTTKNISGMNTTIRDPFPSIMRNIAVSMILLRISYFESEHENTKSVKIAGNIALIARNIVTEPLTSR